jgi:hypothetical protein
VQDEEGIRVKDYSARFREIVEAQLPDDARILMPRGGADLMILVTWRLHSDPTRPSKRSRLVRVVVSEQALEDYAIGSEARRAASDVRLVTWLRSRLGDFDPDHEAPLGVEPPAVTWRLDSAELNG